MIIGLCRRLPVLTIVLLAGCGSTPPPTVEAPIPTIDPVGLLESLRRHARELGETSVDVAPLRDAERGHWIDLVRQRQSSGDLDGAAAALEQALAALPDDPELLQEAAELALLRTEWERAVELAGRAYERGPRVGELCRRSWLTVATARDVLHDPARGRVARERLDQCSPPPPVRM